VPTRAQARTKDARSRVLRAPEVHDLIRVHGARVNNLKDLTLEIPKRRLTVFTGVSGSGKRSLVFDTIAAESQRLINETYSSFVQGFMPTLAHGAITIERGAGKTVKKTFTRTGGMCARCEGLGTVSVIDLTQLYDDSKSLNDGALTIPGYQPGGWNFRPTARRASTTRTSRSARTRTRSCTTFSTTSRPG
jgi:excinuclease UvrABC ATPase subunit